MSRIDGERCQDGKDLIGEVSSQVGAIILREGTPVDDQLDAGSGQRREDFLHQAAIVATLQFAYDGRDRGQLLFGRQAVGGRVLVPRRNLLAKTGDANLEKLVQVRRKDGQELETFEQRGSRVFRFVQHPAVELEPGEFAIDIERRVAEVDGGTVGRNRHGGEHRAGMPCGA